MEDKELFQYTYSAKQQEEIKAIRSKYTPPQEDKMAQLRRLDAGVTQKATTLALIMGILGALIMGSGMSLVMTELWQMLNIGHTLSMLIGISLGVCGMILVSLAYPLYNRVVKKEREKIAPQILQLTEELLQ